MRPRRPAEFLRQDQVGRQLRQQPGIKVVDRLPVHDPLGDHPIDVGARVLALRQNVGGQMRLPARVLRVVALMRHANDSLTEAERITDLSRAGQE
jgi:hypothetical protein